MNQERLVLGQIPPQEAEFRRRRHPRTEKPANQETYAIYRAIPMVEAALQADSRNWQEESANRKKQQKEILKAIWGENVELPFYISPSTASFCLRWVGYEALGYTPAPRTMKSNLAMMIGSASHYSLLRAIGRAIPGLQETSFTIEEDDLSGRVDFLFRNPRTNEYQILEFKFTSDFGFRQVTREKLPDYLRSTKGVFQPQPEHRKQVLLYMYAKRKEGLDIACANVVYIDKNTGEMKDALVVWDALAEFDASELVSGIKEAKTQIERKELPEPTVESAHVCERFCPYRVKCEHGQRFAAGEVRREQKRRPKIVYQKAKEQREAKRRRMEEQGLVQGQLPGFMQNLEVK